MKILVVMIVGMLGLVFGVPDERGVTQNPIEPGSEVVSTDNVEEVEVKVVDGLEVAAEAEEEEKEVLTDEAFFELIDSLYMTRDQEGNLILSIKKLETFLAVLDTRPKEDPQTVVLKYKCNWRLARHISFVDDYSNTTGKEKTTRKEKLAYYKKGETYANQAIQLDEYGVEGYYWKGVVLGRGAVFRGIMESLFSVGPIESAMKQLVQVDSDFARAHFVLSRLYRKAPSFISVGDIKKSQLHILKAVQLAPDDSFIQLELGKVLQAIHNPNGAKRAYEKVIQMVIPEDEFAPEIEKNKEEARSLLKKLKPNLEKVNNQEKQIMKL